MSFSSRSRHARTALTTAAVVGLFSAAAAAPAGASVILNVVAAEGPNPPGTTGYPSLDTFATNAIYALQHNLVTYGDPNSPGYYKAVTAPEVPTQNVGTTFNSFNGQANPTGAYASEYGNHIYFGLDAIGDGTTRFSIADLTFSSVSSDPNHTLNTGPMSGLNYPYSQGYSFEIVGIDYGPDRTRGTADDKLITSGPNTQQVDEIVTRGVGNYWTISSTSPGATNQSRINNVSTDYSLPSTPFTFVGTYSLLGVSNSATVVFNSVPEPSTTTALAIAALPLLSRRRRK